MSFKAISDDLLTTRNCQNCLHCKQVPGIFKNNWNKDGKMKCKKEHWFSWQTGQRVLYGFRPGQWNRAKCLVDIAINCIDYDDMGE